MMAAERGAARNTLAAYRRDLEQAAEWVKGPLGDADAPLVTRIDGSDAMAVQAVCRGTLDWQRLEALERAGARGLMVLPIERMLA